MIIPYSVEFLLFDMDGTLVDTEPVGPKNFINQLEKHCTTPTQEELDIFKRIWRRDGTDIKQDDWLPEIARKYKINLSSEDYLKEFYEMYSAAIIKASVLPGVDEFLHSSKNSGAYKMAVVTASKKHQVEAILKEHGWEDIFDAIVTSEDFTKHKPDPEPFTVGVKKLRAVPAKTVVFEDSKNGSLSGSAAGCYVIGLQVGNEEQQDLSSANTIVQDFNEVQIR